MKGKTIKDDLQKRGVSAAAIAKKLGISQQTFSATLQNDDIKTGFLEKVADALGVPPAYFYNGDSGGVAVVGKAVDSTVIGRQDGATEALVKQLDVKDEQIDRLLGLLEKK